MKVIEKKFGYVKYVAGAGEKCNDKGEVLGADGKPVRIERTVKVQMPENDKDIAALYTTEAKRAEVVSRAHLIIVRADNTPTECVKPSSNPEAQKERAQGKVLGGATASWSEPDKLALQVALSSGDFGTAGTLFAKYAKAKK